MLKKVVLFVVLVLFLFGCVSQSDQAFGDNKENGSDVVLNPVEGSGASGAQSDSGRTVFCKNIGEYKFFYEEHYFDEFLVESVVTESFFKKSFSDYTYFDRLKGAPEKVGTWGFADKDEFVVYSNADGGCFAYRHKQEQNPFLKKETDFFVDEFSGETKKIGGEEGWKMKEATGVKEKYGVESDIITIIDFVSREYCVPLTQDIQTRGQSGLELVSHSEKKNFSRNFSDDIFELPPECKNVAITDLTK